MQHSPLTLASPATLWAGLGLVAIAVVVVLVRRPALPRTSKLLGVIGLLLLALAAGDPGWRRSGGHSVTVMVDLSPSTRAARFREPAYLRQRLRQLVDDAPARILYFGAGREVTDPPTDANGEPLADLVGRRTILSPPTAGMVLLFSDGQFDPPAFAPPTHVVADEALEEPPDASVRQMEVRGDELAVTVLNSGGPRTLSLAGPWETAQDVDIPPGGLVVTRPLPPHPRARTVTARLTPGDAWPENDALSLFLPPPARAERWWVGSARGGGGWRTLPPAELPADPAAYLAPAVIVLDNLAASDLTDLQQQRLRQYVRDLGGGLVILGGGRAFAAGGYSGTPLDALSPLASHPTAPTSHWVFLVDSSGSMNAAAPGGTRWNSAVAAVARAVATLPPHDLVSVAGFAADVQWWWRDRVAGEARAEALPPAGARPSGATELARALEAATAVGGKGPPVELVALTDANAPVPDPEALARLMASNKVRLHLLALGDESAEGLAPLRRVVEATDGTLLREDAPAAWAEAVRRLTRSATPDLLVKEPGKVTFIGALSGAPPRAAAPPWNRTWLKPGAEALGAVAAAGTEPSVAASYWQAGEGRVAAAAFGASPAEAEPLARLVERPPRDARLRVSWDCGEQLRVTINAAGGSGAATPLNGLPLTLELADASGDPLRAPTAALPVPQTGPGRYDLSADAPVVPVVATLRNGGRVVERVAVAGRYAPEFEAVGNDRLSMRDLARRTGGSVVGASQTAPLRVPRGDTTTALSPVLAAAAAAFIALALVRWRVAG
jgi:hypothetical protein